MFSFLVSLASWIWNGIQAAADYVVIALQYAYYALKAGVEAVWDAAKWSYQNILKPIGHFLQAAYDRLKTLYEKVLKPIIEWTQRVTCVLRKVYKTFVQPVLTILDATRKIVELLELLHVAWAKALDEAIANLEHKIAQPLMLAIQVINAIDSRIESYVLTADNLFRSVTLLGSVARDLAPIVNMQWGSMLRNLHFYNRHGIIDGGGLDAPDEQDAFFAAALDDGGGGGDSPGAMGDQFLEDLLAM